MKRVTQVLAATIILGALISGCGLGESQRAEPEGRASPQQTRGEVASEPRQDERLERLASLSFQSALNADWAGIDFIIIPRPATGDSYLGRILLRNGTWTAFYDSGFASSELVRTEQIDAETVRFFVDIWRNATPEEPLAPRQPDTATYRFYVDLSESQFRDLLETGITEEQPRTGASLPAMDMAGMPVQATWWEFAPYTAA